MSGDAPLAGSGCHTERTNRRATISPMRGGYAIAGIVGNGGSGVGRGSLCDLLAKRHKPPPRLQRQPYNRVCGGSGDNLQGGNG